MGGGVRSEGGTHGRRSPSGRNGVVIGGKAWRGRRREERVRWMRGRV